MLEVLAACIPAQHDLRLVLLAAAVCLLACYSAFGIVAHIHTLTRRGRPRILWVVAAAFLTGCGIWATHFIAMLAFDPALPVAYDIGLTGLSVIIAICVSGLGIHLAVVRRLPVLGGAVIGVAIGAMHYVGMMGLRVPGTLHWDAVKVVASLVIGIGLAALALAVGVRARGFASRMGGVALLVLAICGLHFTAMAALKILPDPTIAIPSQTLAPNLLAVVVSSVTLLIITIGVACSTLDARLAERAEQEAARLRVHVQELEQTKNELEARTAEVTAALMEAAAGSQAKSQFLAAMSHELRTPLNAIIGFAEIQAGEFYGPLGNPRYVEYNNHIKSSAMFLLRTINDILDYSNASSSRMTLQRDVFDLSDVVSGAVAEMQDEARKGGVTLALNGGGDMPALSLDRDRIRQALRNVLSNAIRFTPEGGRVTVTTSVETDGCRVVIADTGIGIAPEDIEKALSLFGQVDGRLSRKFDGCGLGLPLAKLLIECHGGRLDIESVVGAGTRVTLTLPFGSSARLVA